MADEKEPTLDELAAQIEKASAEVKEPPKEEPEEPKEPPKEEATTFEYTVEGTTYKGASQQEAIDKMMKALADQKQAIRDRERQIHEFKAKEPKPEPKPEGFDQKRYFEMMEKDAIAAQKYMDRHRFGIDNPEEVLRETAAMVAERKQMGAKNEEFTRFYADADIGYAQIETPELNQLMKERIQETGRPITADNLKLTFLELKVGGKIGTPGKKADPPPKAPPLSAAGAGGTVNPEVDFASLSLEQMKAHLKSLGVESYSQTN